MNRVRHTTGGKRPRPIFRNQPGPANFAIVNFLDRKGNKTIEQEIVPVCWIIHGKHPQCHWPKNEELSRRQLNNMVMTEAAPDVDNFDLFPVRILHSGCTYSDAAKRFESLAVHSHPEAKSPGRSRGIELLADDEDLSESEERSPPKNCRVKSKSTSKPVNLKNSQISTTSKVDLNKSFEFLEIDPFLDDSETIFGMGVSNQKASGKKEHSNISAAASSFQSKEISVLGGVETSSQRVGINELGSQEGTSTSGSKGKNNSTPTLKTPSSVLNRNSSVARALFPTGSSDFQDYVSQGEFQVFETKIFQKLNIIQQMIAELNSKSSASPHELIKYPKSISEKVSLPAMDIKSLETLDAVLNQESVRSELANYLSQLGGRKPSDFLSRSLPKVVSDEVCFFTNWSGSEIPDGTVDIEGNLITREFKKTFSNLTNIIDMFCTATRLILLSTKNDVVESYTKKWLLAFKDRITPRKHVAQADNSVQPRKKSKKSPRKKKTNWLVE